MRDIWHGTSVSGFRLVPNLNRSTSNCRRQSNEYRRPFEARRGDAASASGRGRIRRIHATCATSAGSWAVPGDWTMSMVRAAPCPSWQPRPDESVVGRDRAN